MAYMPPRHVWPKRFPDLTPEQQRISDDFMRHWHEELPKRYGIVDEFNHGYIAKRRPAGQQRTLEIGAGIGEHLEYESLDDQEYHAIEYRPEMADIIRKRFPSVTVTTGDCQARLPFPDGHFTRIIAIHVLEHLPDLPAALAEAERLLTQDGSFQVVIPCDPGFAYGLARRISAQRIFEKRYGQSYDWFISREHINSPDEILSLIRKRFRIDHSSFFPLRIPVRGLNLCLGFTASKRPL